MAKGQPVSVRLGRAAELLVDEERRRSGRSRSAVIEELAEEAAKARLFPGIAFRGPEPRRAWVIGTGLDVWEIAELGRGYEGDFASLLRDFDHLDERAVRLALAYAERFAEEVESAIAENARRPSEWLDLYPLIGFTERR
jgi:uncharacterized protein (DUF433 family)